ncbi:MAG TPA: hypothetical protein VN864_05970, partial [Thermoplasmata archaeon]|nr:hypothetical protein [Thermoplasmata archaeon]
MLAVPVGWIACFSSSNPPPPGISFDGSIPDSFTYDVALPDSPADAADSPVDSPPDAVVEAGPAPVVVTVVGIGGLEASVPIVYGDSTGAVSATGTTDANGQASKVVPAGSMITAVMGTAANPWLYTVMGVEPGDSLLVIDRTLPASASFPVQFDGLPTPLPVIDSGSPNYVVYAGGCTNYGMSWSLDLASNSQCIGIGRLGPTLGPAYPLLAEAYDNSSPQNLVGFAFQKDNPLSPLDDAGVLDPVLPGPWSTASTTQTLTGVNVPDGGLSYYLQLSEVADGLQTPLLQQQAMPMFFTHTGYA